jgi:sodium/proline symporter
VEPLLLIWAVSCLIYESCHKTNYKKIDLWSDKVSAEQVWNRFVPKDWIYRIMHGGLIMPISMLITFIIYLTAVVLVGIVAYKVTQNLSDFVLGGRKLNGPVAALSAGASDMSAWLLLALPGAVYAMGLSQIWLPIGLTLGAYFNWLIIAPRLRVYTEVANDSLTVPAFLDNRFQENRKIIRALSALATLVFFAFYTSSGLVGGALLLSKTFHLDYHPALYLGTAIIVAYTFVGGFLAVSWTDFFQGSLMFCCLLIVPILGVMGFGGLEQTVDTIQNANPHAFSFTDDLDALMFINLMAWGFGYFGQPHILVRFMAVSNLKQMPIARRICMTWMIFSMVGAVLTGLVGVAVFPDLPVHERESVFILFSAFLFKPWVAGFVLAAILSSIMCAIDSQMLASSSALTEDVYRAILRPNATQKELMMVGRFAVILIALIALSMAHGGGSTVLSLVSFAWAGLACTFAAPVCIALFWPRMTSVGAILGMALGMGTTILWHFVLEPMMTVKIYEMIPGLIMSLLGVFLGSLWSAPPKKHILEQFNQVQSLLQKDQAV